MNPEPKLGAPVDPTKPTGPKWGDPGHLIPVTAAGAPADAPPVPFCPLVGDVVSLKSGGPAMTVIARSVPGEDPSATCQWFCPVSLEVTEKKFLLSSLMVSVPAATAAWAPAPVALK